MVCFAESGECFWSRARVETGEFEGGRLEVCEHAYRYSLQVSSSLAGPQTGSLCVWFYLACSSPFGLPSSSNDSASPRLSLLFLSVTRKYHIYHTTSHLTPPPFAAQKSVQNEARRNTGRGPRAGSSCDRVHLAKNGRGGGGSESRGEAGASSGSGGGNGVGGGVVQENRPPSRG